MLAQSTTYVPNIDSSKTEAGAELLKALAHPLRVQILQFIDAEAETNVNSIYTNLDLEQSITSQHLAVLRVNGLVTSRRKGKYVLYMVNQETLARVKRVLGLYFR